VGNRAEAAATPTVHDGEDAVQDFSCGAFLQVATGGAFGNRLGKVFGGPCPEINPDCSLAANFFNILSGEIPAELVEQ
jgi:hypothetical protein